MTTGTITLHTWTCDGRGFRACGREVRTESDTEMPPGWIAFDWYEADPRGASVGGVPMLIPKVLHFHEPDCLAWWLSELPIMVGMRHIGEANEPRQMQDAVGWSGRSPDHLYGCPSCKRRDGYHDVGCTLHR